MGNSPKIYELWRQAARDRQAIRDLRVELLGDYDPVIESEAAAIGLELNERYQQVLRDYDPVIESEAESDRLELEGTFQLYVGADNKTGMVDVKQLYKVLNVRHTGWTVVFTVGAWEGKQETSCVVTIVASELLARGTARHLARALNQDSVGIVRIGDAMGFVS